MLKQWLLLGEVFRKIGDLFPVETNPHQRRQRLRSGHERRPKNFLKIKKRRRRMAEKSRRVNRH